MRAWDQSQDQEASVDASEAHIRLFWDLPALQMSNPEHADFIARRTLIHGDWDDLVALRDQMGSRTLATWIRSHGGAGLTARQLRLIELLVDEPLGADSLPIGGSWRHEGESASPPPLDEAQCERLRSLQARAAAARLALGRASLPLLFGHRCIRVVDWVIADAHTMLEKVPGLLLQHNVACELETEEFGVAAGTIDGIAVTVEVYPFAQAGRIDAEPLLDGLVVALEDLVALVMSAIAGGRDEEALSDLDLLVSRGVTFAQAIEIYRIKVAVESMRHLLEGCLEVAARYPLNPGASRAISWVRAAVLPQVR